MIWWGVAKNTKKTQKLNGWKSIFSCCWKKKLKWFSRKIQIQHHKQSRSNQESKRENTMSFERAYVEAFGELSRAQDFHNRNNSKRNLSYADMKPETFKSSFFHSRISESLRCYIKILYDASLYGNNIVNGLMNNIQHALGNCCVVQNSEYDIERVYICDLKKTKTMFTNTHLKVI